MATIIVTPGDTAQRKEKPEKVFYRVEQDGKSCDFTSAYKLQWEEWISGDEIPVITVNNPARKKELNVIQDMIQRETDALRRIARGLDRPCSYCSARDIVEVFKGYMAQYRIRTILEQMEKECRASGRLRTAETYRTTSNRLRAFLIGRNAWMNGGVEDDIHIIHFTPDFLISFEAWMRNKGLVPNTVSFYMRILRSAYNRGVELRAVDDMRPFRRVYTGMERTVKRALPANIIRKIRDIDLEGERELAYARDMFMMSFYLRGMSLVDMAFLRRSNLVGNMLTYRRSKTGQKLTVQWTGEMQSLLSYYPRNETDYLLPIIRNNNSNAHYAYRHECARINAGLRELALRIGIKGKLTMYVARHSWASIAYVKGVPISVISKGMGHESEKTTRIYLAELDKSVVDRANATVLKALNSGMD